MRPYAKAVGGGQYWRCITASVSHLSLLHLLFNMSSLWSLGVVEQMPDIGSSGYLKFSLVLLVGTMIMASCRGAG